MAAHATGLANVALFTEFQAEELDDLSARMRRRRYSKGETIFLRGDPGDSLFIVESGSVRIGLMSADGKEVTLSILGPGAFFGELALLDGEPRSADAVAQEVCHLRLLQRDDFLRFIGQRPSVAASLIRVLSQKLRRDAQIVEDAAFLDVPARLAMAILRLADTKGESGNDDAVVISTRLTQADLAGLVGTRRESVNRWLRFYEDQGWIHYDRGRITVLHPQALRKRVY